MFYLSRMYRYYQRILWIVLCSGLLIQSTAFALLVLPSEPVLSDTPEALFAVSLTETTTFKTESQPDSIISAPKNKELKNLDANPDPTFSDLPKLNISIKNAQGSQSNPWYSSASNVLGIEAVNVAKDVDFFSQSAQLQKSPTGSSDTKPFSTQIPSAENRITFLHSGMKIENQTVIGENIEGSTLNRFDFIMNFGDITDVNDHKESAGDDVLNWFYKFLQQFMPASETERFEMDTLISEKPVTEEQLKIWLQNIITKEEAIFKDAIFKKSENDIHGWSSTIFSPSRNKPTEGKLEIDTQNSFITSNNKAGPQLKNHNYNFCQDFYSSQNKSSPQHSSGHPEKRDLKKKNTDNNATEHSFIIKFLNSISKTIQSFKIWLNQLLRY
jgi:hypothetical protein